MNYEGRSYDIKVGEDVTNPLQKALTELENVEGEKTLVLEKGEYHIYYNKVCSKNLFITNTVGDRQWRRGTVPHKNKIGIWLENQKDLTIDGNGCEFVIHGQMTNIGVVNCKNVTLKNFSIRVENPDMHELKVIDVGKTHIDFEIDKESRYNRRGAIHYFVGEDYQHKFKRERYGWWYGFIAAGDDNKIVRRGNPLLRTWLIKDIEPHKIRARYIIKAPSFKVGDRFYIFEHLRRYNGIFVDRSIDVTLDNVNQHFNYGLAYVAQDCENLAINNCKFAPRSDSSKLMISAADFVHICSCRGKVDIKDSEFVGAGDDMLNVHGIHFIISNIKEDCIEVRFRHHQTHGFNPLRVGDEIAFVDVSSLLERGKAKIVESKLVNETTIRLKLDDMSNAVSGDAIENRSAVPDVNFQHNYMSRIITRGVLMTSGGKVKIVDNNFDNTSMHSILISDDAKYWYESGPVNDVEIARNRFGKVEGYNVQVMPENTVHNAPVHNNISIHDNVIESGEEGGFYFKSAGNVVLDNNTSDKPLRIEVIDSDVTVDGVKK